MPTLDVERLAAAMEAYCKDWYIDLDKSRPHTEFDDAASGIADHYPAIEAEPKNV